MAATSKGSTRKFGTCPLLVITHNSGNAIEEDIEIAASPLQRRASRFGMYLQATDVCASGVLQHVLNRYDREDLELGNASGRTTIIPVRWVFTGTQGCVREAKGSKT